MEMLEKYAADATMLAGTMPQASSGAAPGWEKGLNRQYFGRVTNLYAAKVGQVSTDCYDALCQGLNAEDWYAFTPVKLRSSFATKMATGETMPDDWQRVHIIAPAGIQYLPVGAYLTYAGNTWISFKSMNMGTALAHAIVRRCNATINVLDFYGNIVSVPMSYAKLSTLGNSNTITDESILAQSYINCICQKNQISAAFRENTRFILGSSAYTIRGLNDFTQEFTGDTESVHLLTFTIFKTEPLEQDSLEMQCADYGSFSWEISVTANGYMHQGGTQTLAVNSIRNGDVVASTAENPISYAYESSNSSVVEVSGQGEITAIGPGSATVTVTLDQNPAIEGTVQIVVGDAAGTSLEFTNTPVVSLGEYETAVLSAVLFVNGAASDEPVTFSFSGAPPSAYDAQVDGNSVTITCYLASNTPLKVTASASGESAQSLINLTT